MKRWLATSIALLVCSTVLRADVTLVQTTTVEGGMAAMASSAGASVSPTMTTRLKGMKSRTDIEAGPMTMSTIVDVAGRQMIVLRPDLKTASVVSTAPPAAGRGPAAPQMTLPTVDAKITPTGKSQVIDGLKCDEYAFTTTADMSEMSGAQMPPEAAAMMNGMKILMTGAMWVARDAPGGAEYLAFQKAVAASDMAAAAAGATGLKIPGLEKLMKAMSGVDGLPYRTETTITIDGTGQMADMMRQMGPMKVTTKVTSIKTDPVADDAFKIPEGYTVTKPGTGGL